MLKRWVLILVLTHCGSAQAEDIGPWIGGAVVAPEQVSIMVQQSNALDMSQSADCTIYSCYNEKNIVKPELKSASNP